MVDIMELIRSSCIWDPSRFFEKAVNVWHDVKVVEREKLHRIQFEWALHQNGVMMIVGPTKCYVEEKHWFFQGILWTLQRRVQESASVPVITYGWSVYWCPSNRFSRRSMQTKEIGRSEGISSARRRRPNGQTSCSFLPFFSIPSRDHRSDLRFFFTQSEIVGHEIFDAKWMSKTMNLVAKFHRLSACPSRTNSLRMIRLLLSRSSRFSCLDVEIGIDEQLRQIIDSNDEKKGETTSPSIFLEHRSRMVNMSGQIDRLQEDNGSSSKSVDFGYEEDNFPRVIILISLLEIVKEISSRE